MIRVSSEQAMLAVGCTVVAVLALLVPAGVGAVIESAGGGIVLGMFLILTQVRNIGTRLRLAPPAVESTRASTTATVFSVLVNIALLVAVGALLLAIFGTEAGSVVAGATVGLALSLAWASIQTMRVERATGATFLRPGRKRLIVAPGWLDVSGVVRTTRHARDQQQIT